MDTNKKKLIFLGFLMIFVLVGKAQIIISGYLANPDGSDSNYEYVQLMATADIDFANTQYSLIAYYGSPEATYPVKGWATGGAETYKFELTSGSVKKGEFFYVGGSKKNINGSGSTDISSANWIRVTAYKTRSGDGGNGKGRAGLFTNSGNANGIAVFNGASVTQNNVPIDVVFFGELTGPYYQASPELGYRICDNDLYLTKAGSFFGKGSNTTTFSHAGSKKFSKLGGMYSISEKKWIRKRSLTKTTLSATSLLSVIESGKGVTKLE